MKVLVEHITESIVSSVEDLPCFVHTVNINTILRSTPIPAKEIVGVKEYLYFLATASFANIFLGLSNIDNDYLFLCFINHNKGPLVQYVSGRAVLIGVVSFGYGCGKIRAPGIYAKVDNVLPWIEKMKRTYN